MPAPRAVGASMISTSWMRGEERHALMEKSKPKRRPQERRVGIWKASWKRPAARMAYEMNVMRLRGSALTSGQTTSAMIQTKFRMTGVSEEILNFCWVLSMAETMATWQMSSAYGSMMRISGKMISQRLPAWKKGSAIHVAAMSKITKTPMTALCSPITRAAKVEAASLPSLTSVSVNTGIKALLKAPSPKRRRKRFGRRNATTKADCAAEVPK